MGVSHIKILIKILIPIFTMGVGCSPTTKSKSSSTTSASPAALTNTLKYYNHYPFNFVYTANLTIGGQNIEAVVDTGSANLLAIGDAEHCPNCVNSYGYDSTYTPGSTSTELSDKWFMNFAPIGQASVQAYQDSVSYEGYNLPTYQFGMVYNEENIPNIWGIGYKAVARPSHNPQTPFFDALVSKYNFKNQFSMTLCGTKNGSSITIGGYDPKLSSVLSKVVWTPVTQKIWYSIEVKKMYTAETALDLVQGSQWVWTPSSSDNIIVDSGTNPLVIPAAQISSLVTVLKSYASTYGITISDSFWPTSSAKGSYATISDSDIAKFPVIHLDVPSFDDSSTTITLSISPKVYFQTRPDTRQRYLGIHAGSSINILGTVLMENYVVLHERGNLQDTTDDTAKVGFYPISSFCN